MSRDDVTANFHGGDPESVGAHGLAQLNAGRDRERISRLATKRGRRGITCDEAERLLGLPHQTCSARFSELKRDGVLLPMGATRPTRNGAQAQVMVAGHPTRQPDLFDG